MKAVAYFEDKIYSAPHGRDEEVIVAESQMLFLIQKLET
jgi:hypothetical protein